MVFSSEVPIEAPSCWPTMTVAEATPASCGATPNVPVLMDGAITMPMPAAARMSGPTTPAPYPVCGPSWASQTAPPAAASIPPATSGLGPTRGISTMVARLEARAEPALNGRNATPVTSGEYPSVCCR